LTRTTKVIFIFSVNVLEYILGWILDSVIK